jgi:hypothetical protein
MSAALQLQPEAPARGKRWGYGNGLPAELVAALAGNESAPAVAQRFGKTSANINWWRRRLFPTHPLSRPSRRGKALTPRGAAPTKVVLERVAAVEVDPSGFTPRQREVFSLPVHGYLLAELVRERPQGACIVCWRDLGAGRGTELLACSRFRPGTKTQVCQVFMAKVQLHAQRKQERAKQSLFQEGGES